MDFVAKTWPVGDVKNSQEIVEAFIPHFLAVENHNVHAISHKAETSSNWKMTLIKITERQMSNLNNIWNLNLFFTFNLNFSCLQSSVVSAKHILWCQEIWSW